MGQAFAIELMFSLTYIFFVFNTGLDPKQKHLLGTVTGTVLVGLALAVCNLVSGLGREQYSGACKDS